MSELATGIFVGRAVKFDPAIGPTSEHTTFVCVVLEGQEGRPGVTICEQADLEALSRDFRNLTHNVSLLDRLGRTRMIFDAPNGIYSVTIPAVSLRYECLDTSQIIRFLETQD